MRKIKFKLEDVTGRIKSVIQAKGARIWLTVIACALALILLVALVSIFFSVREFEISGETKYDINEIIDASGIRTGDRLYWLGEGRAEKRIAEACPYIESIEIKRVFPNKIRFEIVEKTSGWYIQVGEDFYSLDYDMIVLSETYNEESLIDRGLTKLILPELQSVVCGEYPKFGEGDEHLVSETLKIIDNIRNREVKNRMTLLDISDRFHIKMIVDRTFSVDFGDMGDADTKFDMIDQVISTALMKKYAGGEITVIGPAEHSFRGYYAEQTEDDATEDSNNTGDWG